MKHAYRIAILLATALLVLAVTPFFGSSSLLKLADVMESGSTGYGIFWKLRVPRVLTAFLAGASLSLGGACFQTLFRNNLATPYTLGVSGGASLGVAIAVRLGLAMTFVSQSSLSLFAFAGALLSALLVFSISRFRGRRTTETTLLAGVAVSFLFSSLIMFMQYIGREADLFRAVRWMVGNLAITGYRELCAMLPFCMFSAIVLFLHHRELDTLSVGDEFAATRGVNIRRCFLVVFMAVSLMVGSVVAFCGPIGFVGMVCPHICRRLVGAPHRLLLPASLLFGGAFLVLCDTFGRTIIAPSEMPVGIITALLGAPFFLWLLFKKRVVSD